MTGFTGFRTCADCGASIPFDRQRCDECREAREARDPDDGYGACIECGRLVLAGTERCSSCTERHETGATPAAGDPAAAYHARQEAMGPAGGGAAAGRSHPYRPTGTLAASLRVMLTAILLADGFLLGAAVGLWRMTGRQLDNPFAYALADYRNQQQLLQTLSWVETAFALTVLVLFMWWMFRAYGNVPAMGARRSRGRGWAIGGWLIPFVNFVMPKRIVDELWQTSTLEGPTESAAGMRLFPRVHRNVHLWWGLFLGGRLIMGIANASVIGDDLSSVRNALATVVFAVAAEMAAAILAMWVVATISSRQAARAASSGRTVSEIDGTRGLRPSFIAAAVVAAGLAVAGFAFFEIDPSTSSSTAADGTPGRYEGFGIAFEYPADLISAQSSVTGTGEPGDEGGIVFLSDGLEASGAVTWIFDFGYTDDDLRDIVDSSINSMASELGVGVLVERSDWIDLAGAPTPFFGRPFQVSDDTGALTGVVAAGRCAEEPYAVMVVWGGSGNRNPGSGIEMVTGILATLDC
ncbi:MAG: DUF4328 domain-containing protein [Actinobacteria bacterium]|nr:DUF4328 domain-containing protein [Actinomycetota bacterium]